MKRFSRTLTTLLMVFSLTACSSGPSDAEHVAKAQQFLAAGKINAAAIELKNALRKNKDNAQARFLLGKLNLELDDPAGAAKELRLARKLGVADEQVVPLLAEALLLTGATDEVLALDATSLPSEAKARTLAAQGVAKLMQGSKDDAEKLINQALEEYPASPQVQTAQARFLASQGRLEEAVDRLEKTLTTHPDFADGWSLLGTLEQRLGKHQAAVKALDKAIELRKNDLGDRLVRVMSLISLGKMDQAQKDLALLKRRLPQHTGVNYAQGLLYFRQENLKDARIAFEQAITAANANPLAYYFLAVINLLEDHLEQADSYAEQFLTRLPDNVAGRKLAARIKLKLNQPQRAEQLLRPLANQDQGDEEAMNLLATALTAQGKIEEAVAFWDRIAKTNPQSAAAQLRLGAGLMAQGEQEEAAKYLRKALEMDPNNPQASLLLIVNLVKEKAFDKALEVARQLQEKQPDSPLPYDLMGQIELAAKNLPAAKAAFEQAIAKDPGDIAANTKLGALALAEKKLDEALARFNAILEKHPDHLQTLIRIAAAHALAGDEQKMVKALQKAVEAHPNALQPRLILARHYLDKNQPEQASSLLMALDDKQKQIPTVLLAMGRLQLIQQQYTLAQGTLEQLIEARPNWADAHFLLARAYAHLNKAKETERELDKVLELNPNHLGARLMHTRMLMSQRKLDQARKAVESLKAAYPNQPEIIRLEALLNQVSGEENQALADYERLYRNDPTTDNLLSLARMKLKLGDRAGAIELLEAWLAEHPNDERVVRELANSYLLAKRIDKALATYRKLLELNPQDVVAHNNLAWFLRERDPKAALQHAEAAYAAAPESASILDTYALALLANGDKIRALRMIERALDKQPNDPGMQFHHAQILAANGRTDEAIQRLRELLASDPKFDERPQAEQLLHELTGG